MSVYKAFNSDTTAEGEGEDTAGKSSNSDNGTLGTHKVNKGQECSL
jgi:hypothetical protein